MPRRDYLYTPKGKLYCVNWPEWHVECGSPDCGENTMLCAAGEAGTVREAQRLARAGDGGVDPQGWKLIDGLWYCPRHIEESQ